MKRQEKKPPTREGRRFECEGVIKCPTIIERVSLYSNKMNLPAASRKDMAAVEQIVRSAIYKRDKKTDLSEA